MVKLRHLKRTFIVLVLDILAQDLAETFLHIFCCFGLAGEQ